MMKVLVAMLAGGLLFGAGAAAYHFAVPHEAPKREAPLPPPPDRTGEVLDEIATLKDALKAFATAIDAAADEREQLASALAAARTEGASGAADTRRALAKLQLQIEAVSRHQQDLTVWLTTDAKTPEPPPAPEPVEPPPPEVQAPAPAPQPPPAPEAPGPPKRKTLAELLAEKKRVDPRDALTRYRLLEGYCNVGFDGVSTIHNFTGQSRKVAGELRLHLNDVQDHASGKLSVPTETLDSGNADRDADMRKALGAPEIMCEILGFEKKDARVRFTINGVAKEMTVPVELAFEKGLLHAKGEAKLRMSDFGVKVQSAAFGMVTVDDLVTIWWDLYAEVSRDASR